MKPISCHSPERCSTAITLNDASYVTRQALHIHYSSKLNTHVASFHCRCWAVIEALRGREWQFVGSDWVAPRRLYSPMNPSVRKDWCHNLNFNLRAVINVKANPFKVNQVSPVLQLATACEVENISLVCVCVCSTTQLMWIMDEITAWDKASGWVGMEHSVTFKIGRARELPAFHQGSNLPPSD